MVRTGCLWTAAFIFTVVIPTVVTMMFPEIDQGLGWRIVLLSAVVGILLGVAGYRVRPRGRDSEAKPPKSAKLIPAAEALDLIVAHFKPQWGGEIIDGHHHQMAAGYFRESAADGKLVVRGRHAIHGGGFSGIWGDIRPEFWKANELDLDAVLDPSPRVQRRETRPEGRPYADGDEAYAGLRASGVAVDSLWPAPRKLLMSGPIILMLLGGGLFGIGAVWQMYRSVTTSPAGPELTANPPEIIAEPANPDPLPVSEPARSDEQGKQFTNRSIDELFALFDGRTFLQGSKLFEPYKGLWIRTSGRLISALDDNQYGFLISMWVNDHLVDCRFDRNWGDALMRYNENEVVSVVGKISQNQDPQKIKLDNCELVQP